MPIDKKFIGKKYGPTTYVIGAEKLREFAYAISGGVPSMGFTGTGAPRGLSPLLHDADAAKAGPYGGLIGLPNFAVVFSIAPFGQAVTDPRTRVAGGQTYTFAANEITPYTAYYVWVAAYNANGNSTPAAGSGTAGSAPNAPTGITIDTSRDRKSVV